MALATLLRLKTKVRGEGSATRVGVESFEFSYTDIVMIVEIGAQPTEPSPYYRKKDR